MRIRLFKRGSGLFDVHFVHSARSGIPRALVTGVARRDLRAVVQAHAERARQVRDELRAVRVGGGGV